MQSARPARAPSRPIPAILQERARRLTGRAWVLGRVFEWLQAGSERYFLLTGAPGSGKSIIAAWLAAPPGQGVAGDQLDAVRAGWAAVHFCMVRGRNGSIDPRRFARLLATQLADRYDEFALAAMRNVAPQYNIRLDVRENWGKVVGVQAQTLFITGANAADVFSLAVSEPLRVLLEDRPQERIPILVDGLDEALTPVVPNILGLLSGHSDLPDNVRLLLTSRNERRVVDQFTMRPGEFRRLDLSARQEAVNNDGDIRAHVVRRIAESPGAGQLAGAGAVGAAADAMARQARGNFLYVDMLLDEVTAGRRQLADLAGLPSGLYDLYRSYLDRLMPDMEQYGRSDLWLNHYKPLLGSLSVAVSDVTAAQLARWLGWDRGEVIVRLDDLQQLVTFDPTEGFYQLYHGSMADFLAAEVERDTDGRPNRYYVSPEHQHERIVSRYLDRDRADDWSDCDLYGLRYLPRHLQLWIGLAEGDEQRRRRAARLYELVLSSGFRSSQQARLGDLQATAAGFRIALEVAQSLDDIEACRRILNELASSPNLELRGLTVEGLVKLHQQAPVYVLEEIGRLLASESPEAWSIGLKAAYLIGPAARAVFRWIALEGSTPLQQAAVYALYLRWSPEPGNFAAELMDDLAEQVSLAAPRRTRRILEFLADLSITVYTNHCDEPSVVERTSHLWHRVLKHRLHLDVLNRPVLDRLTAHGLSRMFARRILDGLLKSELQDPARFFEASAEEKALFRRMIPFVDPAVGVMDHHDDLAALLRSDITPFRILATTVIAVQACDHFDQMEPVLRELFPTLGSPGRLWLLLAFAVLLRETPDAWVPLLEDLTGTFMTEDWEDADVADLLAIFNAVLLPLGLAYGKRDGLLPCFEDRLRDGLARGDLGLVRRCIEGLGPVAFYHPQAVFRALRNAGVRLNDPCWEQSLVASLAAVRILHIDQVDGFLERGDAAHLIPEVSARSEVELVRRYIAWIGGHTNVVNQALHYPRMRYGLLVPFLTTLADSADPKEFMMRFSPGPLSMIRDVDYELIRWTLPT
jgi:hypothetical protein